MNYFKKLWILLLLISLTYISCDTAEDNTLAPTKKIEVRFSTLLNTPLNKTLNNKEVIPTCENNNASPTSIYVRIDGEDYFLALTNTGELSTDYVLLSTNVPHVLQEFIVLDVTGFAIWAATHAGGVYQDFINEAQRLPREFIVLSGQKPIITQQVLCFSPTKSNSSLIK